MRAIRAPVYLGVAGQTAAYLDLEHSLGAHLPAVLAVIVAATLIVLFLFTGSVVLPIKAVLMNTLSLSAVLGILVLIFQDGNLQGLLSYSSQGALDATQPILLAAVALRPRDRLRRVPAVADQGGARPRARRTPRPSRSGWSEPGAIVTAAALLFAVAIGAFATSKLVFIKELGARHRARGADRRLDHPRAAGAVADGAARLGELVGAETAAAPARPDRPTGAHIDTEARAHPLTRVSLAAHDHHDPGDHGMTRTIDQPYATGLTRANIERALAEGRQADRRAPSIRPGDARGLP